jgi:hypothetical protein
MLTSSHSAARRRAGHSSWVAGSGSGPRAPNSARADGRVLGDGHAQRRQAFRTAHELSRLRFFSRQGRAAHVALEDDHPR